MTRSIELVQLTIETANRLKPVAMGHSIAMLIDKQLKRRHTCRLAVAVSYLLLDMNRGSQCILQSTCIMQMRRDEKRF